MLHLASILFTISVCSLHPITQSKPVAVFILAGQSNMEGHGIIPSNPDHNGGKGTLEFLAKNPGAETRFKRLLDRSGNWIVRDDVWIHYLDRKGKLTTGFGAREDRIGPELGFGNIIGDATDEPVLLIKLAWGGKSLAVDFRPPSSGGAVGPFYQEIVQRTKSTLANLDKEFPELAGRGYKLAGFGWHQGWNDRVTDAYNEEYEKNMANFIRDIRKDLGVKQMPFVIAETGMGGLQEKNVRALALMKAQAAVAEYPEFKGNVAFVGTRKFWREKDVSPTQQDYHWHSNAETYYLIGESMGLAMKNLLRVGKAPQAGEMAGYLLVPHSRVAPEFNAGFSMYVAAWPLLSTYPGDRFQTGLFGTWMFAQNEKQEGKTYSDIEGGLGWWRDTRFATVTPKFIMGGVALDFVEWANGPGAGKGRNWNNPTGLYGVAQLSQNVLWPPDGLNLKQGTSGELLGYGYLPLPLAEAKNTTAGKNVPTGDQCWTLFLNSGNFKGPVAFFTPYFFSKPTLTHPEHAGQFLDSRPSNPNRAIQMETQYVPCYTSVDSQGKTYARIAPTSFPQDITGDSVLIHCVTAYKKSALWDGVKGWFGGKKPVTGKIDSSAAILHTFPGGGGSTWEIYGNDQPDETRSSIAWNAFANPIAVDEHTYGYRWDATLTSRKGPLTTLPEYFTLGKNKNGADQWEAISASEVPRETGLWQVSFGRPLSRKPEPYVTPDDPKSCWKVPGPKAGPFTVQPGDGSVVTYYWYRFADQPALLNADLTKAERETMQKKVEMIHRHWRKDQEYLPAPKRGKLANLDPALIVRPPKGFEVGYVPIVTRQAARE